MDILTFKLTDFEGPLDLLLALISKNKMNIYDIRIVELIDQYLEVVNMSDAQGMETASEFIEMAAKLIYMKSVFLLPKDDEQDRIREELTGILVEYSACKRVAASLKAMGENVFFAVREPADIQLDTAYSILHDKGELEKAYTALMGKGARKRQPKAEQFDELVAVPFVSVTSRIVHLMRNLMTGKLKKLKDFFKNPKSKSETVATFLAVLELVRAGRISIDNSEELKLNRKIEKRAKM